MSELRKAAEMALEALMQKGEHHPKVYQAAEALRQALAQPKREWVGLTDEEINDWFFQRLKKAGAGWALDDVVRAVEAKLKEKNGG